MDPTIAAFAGIGGAILLLALAFGLAYSGWYARGSDVRRVEAERDQAVKERDEAQAAKKELKDQWSDAAEGGRQDLEKRSAIRGAASGPDDGAAFERVLQLHPEGDVATPSVGDPGETQHGDD